MATARCVHRCACGARLICADADHCAVGPFWTCPACLLDQQDDYFSLMHARFNPTTTQEQARHEKH